MNRTKAYEFNLTEIRRHAVILTVEEQHELFRKWKDQQDMEARNRLLYSVLLLIVKEVNRITKAAVPDPDLIQEGFLGLLRSLETFDPDKQNGASFNTYSSLWMRAYIYTYLKKSPLVLPPQSKDGIHLSAHYNKAVEALQRRGISPSPEAVANELQVKESEVVAYINARQVERLDAPAFEDGSFLPKADRLVSVQPMADVYVTQRELSRLFNEFAETKLKNDRHRKIWYERVVSQHPKTLEELGRDFCLTRERIRQIEREIKTSFKKFCTSRGVDLSTV